MSAISWVWGRSGARKRCNECTIHTQSIFFSVLLHCFVSYPLIIKFNFNIQALKLKFNTRTYTEAELVFSYFVLIMRFYLVKSGKNMILFYSSLLSIRSFSPLIALRTTLSIGMKCARKSSSCQHIYVLFFFHFERKRKSKGSSVPNKFWNIEKSDCYNNFSLRFSFLQLKLHYDVSSARY